MENGRQNSSCVPGAHPRPAHRYEQPEVFVGRCSTCRDQQAAGVLILTAHWIWLSSRQAPTWIFYTSAEPPWSHNWDRWQLKAVCRTQLAAASLSRTNTMVTHDICRLGAISTIAKWHICTGHCSIYTQSCSNCESQAHNFIPQLF